MPPPEGKQFVLLPVLNRLNKMKEELVSWRNALRDRENHVFEVSDLTELLEKALPILNLPREKVEITPDKFGLFVRDRREKEQLHEQYKRETEGVDRLRPFKEMLTWFYGKPTDWDTVQGAYWRLAAGRDWMLAGRSLQPLFPETGTPRDFWAGLYIASCRYGPPTRNNKLQLTLGFRIMGGPYAGLLFTQHIPFFAVTRKIAKEIGFPLYQKTHYNELVQCVFVGHVVFEEWAGRFSPRVVEYHATSTALRVNRQLREHRERLCQHEGYTWSCYKCSRGYADTEDRYCVRATRPYALVKKLCPRCQRESFFDQDSPSPICVSCQARPFKLLDR